MQVTCPKCGQPIRANNINIQEMAAVCPNCDTVFQFEAQEEKSKRRKVKQPEHLNLRDTETLEMTFRTNWRLSSNENFVGALIGAIMSLFVSGILGSTLLDANPNDIPLFLPLAMGLVAVFLIYSLGTIAYNHTQIVMDDEKIAVSRQPIPVLFNQGQYISLHGVTAIKCEETPISVERGYDLPRFRVWAETVDGVRRLIINDVTEEYAYFITQRLNERLNYDVDVSRLEDAEQNSNHEHHDTIQTQSQADTLK